MLNFRKEFESNLATQNVHRIQGMGAFFAIAIFHLHQVTHGENM